jgi:glycosyltransferase involved in cell wall biosynthesis
MVSVGGRIFGEEKRMMFSKSHISVLTSRYEGFPTVIIDALSAGIPCIVTTGTNAAFLEEKGLGWCSGFDAQGIAEAIKRAVIAYKSRPEAFQVACRKYAEQAFDIKNTVEKTIAIYKSALRE